MHEPQRKNEKMGHDIKFRPPSPARRLGKIIIAVAFKRDGNFSLTSGEKQGKKIVRRDEECDVTGGAQSPSISRRCWTVSFSFFFVSLFSSIFLSFLSIRFVFQSRRSRSGPLSLPVTGFSLRVIRFNGRCGWLG